jgi:hypothetical protein
MSIRRIMRPSPVILIAVSAVAIVAAAVFASLALGNDPVPKKVVAPQPCGDRIYGHIRALEPSGNRFELLFDPAWFTSGVTASAAAARDGAVEPGQPVPNDNYVVDESDRVLTYLVPETAQVTILTRQSSGGIGWDTQSTVAELARIVNGRAHRELFETLDSGVWIRVHNDTVCTLDQQYRP